MGEQNMKVLVTGAGGFIAKNLIAELKQQEEIDIFPVKRDTPAQELEEYVKSCEFVFHLAGVNRPERTEEFMEVNGGFAGRLVKLLKKYGNNCPIVYTSSIQADLKNPYGVSKKEGEEIFFRHSQETGAEIYSYRLPNVFGKWCRPNYNSAVATFCYNIAHNLPVTVNDRNHRMQLVYIDDVVEEMQKALDRHPHIGPDHYCFVPAVHEITLGEIVTLLYSFRESRKNLMIPNMLEGGFEKKLYSTYLSYLPKQEFKYPLVMHKDHRGSFTEILKSADRGQVSVNISKPGICKGNHWHHSKNEKFIVVSGSGVIRFRKYGSDEIIEYQVDGEKLEAVDIPTGYSHCIVNTGEKDLVTLMWCNECFDPGRPDTMFEAVEQKEKSNE